MKTEIRTFNALDQVGIDQDIRIVDKDGEPWFVAADVCIVLGYSLRANGTVDVSGVKKVIGEDESITAQTRNKGRPSLCLSESGLYKLVMRSDKPQAKPFQDWVTKIVLPAIRKDGGYIMGEEKVATGEMNEDEFILRAFTILQQKVDRLTAENQLMHDELNYVTIDEYRALSHRYFTHGFKTKLGRAAAKLARQRSITLEKQARKVTTWGGNVVDSSVYVYPKTILVEAEALIA